VIAPTAWGSGVGPWCVLRAGAGRATRVPGDLATCPTRPHRLPAATSATRDDRRHLINPCRKRPPQGRWVVVLPGKRGRGQRCVHKRGTSETV